MDKNIKIKCLEGPSEEQLNEALYVLRLYIDDWWETFKYEGAPPCEINIDWLVKSWMDKAFFVIVAYDDKKPIGFLTASAGQSIFLKDFIAYSGPFYILPEYRTSKLVVLMSMYLKRFLMKKKEVQLIILDRLVSQDPFLSVAKIIYNRRTAKNGR